MADKTVEISLHPDAKHNFDEKANLLATSLTPDPQVFDDSQVTSAMPYVSGTIGKDDIIPEENVWSRRDHSGREIARFFQSGGRVFGLEGESYLAFRKLAESIQRTQVLRDSISLDTIIDLLTRWLRSTRKGQPELSATDFILSKCREIVSEYTVLMPLYELFVEEPFELGRVLIRTVTAEEIDGWVAAQSREHPEHTESYKQSGEKWKKKHQGRAAASITLVAEPERAYEVARREAEDALAILQVFSIGVLVPEAKCYWTLLGSEKVEAFTYFILQGSDLKNGATGYYRYRNTVWMLSKALLVDLQSRGLDAASALLRESKRNDFQDHVVDALLLYSRAALQDGLTEKLLYILVALESLLLRNETEPIGQNLAERLAVVVGGNVDERKAIIGTTKEAYGLRSQFVHHGVEIDDLKVMDEFMLYAFLFFTKTLKAVDLFQTKIAFLDALEAKRLSY